MFCDRFYLNIKLILYVETSGCFVIDFIKTSSWIWDFFITPHFSSENLKTLLWHYLKLKNTTFFSCRFSEHFSFAALNTSLEKHCQNIFQNQQKRWKSRMGNLMQKKQTSRCLSPKFILSKSHVLKWSVFPNFKMTPI